MRIFESEEETLKFAKALGEELKQKKVMYLTGDLGSGKTTFTKGLASFFGIENFAVKSPTYTYVREHQTEQGIRFFHIDLYRIEEMDELLYYEICEIMENDNSVTVIEWADRLNKKPKEGINIEMEYVDEKTRKIKVDE